MASSRRQEPGTHRKVFLGKQIYPAVTCGQNPSGVMALDSQRRLGDQEHRAPSLSPGKASPRQAGDHGKRWPEPGVGWGGVEEAWRAGHGRDHI